MPRPVPRLKHRKKDKPPVLKTLIMAIIGLLALLFTYQGANNVTRLVTGATSNRNVIASWDFTESGSGYSGWNYVCVDRKPEADRTVIFEPNPGCRGLRAIEYSYESSGRNPLVVPAGNKYVALEAQLKDKTVGYAGSSVLGTSGRAGRFGQLMDRMSAFFLRRRRMGTVPPRTEPGARPPSGQALPEWPQNIAVLLSYEVAGKTIPEQQIPLWMVRDGQVRTAEVRLPDVGEIRISKIRLMVGNVMPDRYEFSIRSITVSTDAGANVPTTPGVPAPDTSPRTTPGPSPEYSGLSGTLAYPGPAEFRFQYRGPQPVTQHIDVSTLPDMGWNVYLDFGTGTAGPITVHDPKKWDMYVCDKVLYWRVRQGDFFKPDALSAIQTARVACQNQPSATPTNTPVPTSPPTAAPPPGGGVKPVMINVDFFNKGMEPAYVYVWMSEGSLGGYSNKSLINQKMSRYVPMMSALSGVTKMVLLSSYETAQYTLEKYGSSLQAAGVTWIGYNTERAPVSTPENEMNAMFSGDANTNSVARLARLADQYGFKSMWGPIRANIDAAPDAALRAMDSGGLDGIAIQEQQYIESSTAVARAEAVLRSASRYRAVMGEVNVSVQVMSSRCPYWRNTDGGKCNDFVHRIAPYTDSVAIWASSPSETGDLWPFIQALRK